MDKRLRDSSLQDLEIEDLPQGWRPTAMIALIKCVDDRGAESWSFRASEELSHEEALGALVIRTELAKAQLLDLYVDVTE